MEKNRKIRRKWKMVVAIVFVLAVMIGIGLKEEERSVEGEPDVISTCENLAILNEGSVLYCGKVSNLLNTANGKVFSKTVDKRDLPKLKKKYNIIGMHSQGNKTYIRFLSDVPILDAESCEPNIEDAYMFYLWHNGATIELSGGEE